MAERTIKVFDEKGNLGIAVYKARRKGEGEWKLLYLWVDYNNTVYRDEKTGELVTRGYYMYVYFGTKIASMLSYDSDGLVGQIRLGDALRNSRANLEKHASLLTYWGEDVVEELFEELEVDWSQGVNMTMYNIHRGKVFPNRFICESFPTYIYKPFWKSEKWDRLPEDNECVAIVKGEFV